LRVHRFHQHTRLGRRREDAFPFFAAAGNLQRITPPELGFRIVTPAAEMKEGARIQYSLSLFGIRFQWLTEITRWDPPHEFVDVQLRGPYRQWIHTHTFREDGDGTLMDDVVDYALPLQPAGEIIAPLVALQVRRIFAYRTRAIARLL